MEVRAFTADLVLPAPVLLVEDDPLVQRWLEGLLLQLGYQSDALIFAGSLSETRTLLVDQPVALALVDLGLPDGSGIDLIAELHADNPGLPILVISAWTSEEAVLDSLRAGAVGYVLKGRDDLEVAMALRNVLRGGAPIDPFVARRIIEELPTAPVGRSGTRLDDTGISAREGEILRLVVEGLSNREIGERLSLSRHTVDAHVRNIYRKLAVNSRVQAVQTARRRGLID
jgi:DNA-binding NarL/FixJ family response regulator